MSLAKDNAFEVSHALALMETRTLHPDLHVADEPATPESPDEYLVADKVAGSIVGKLIRQLKRALDGASGDEPEYEGEDHSPEPEDDGSGPEEGIGGGGDTGGGGGGGKSGCARPTTSECLAHCEEMWGAFPEPMCVSTCSRDPDRDCKISSVCFPCRNKPADELFV